MQAKALREKIFDNGGEGISTKPSGKLSSDTRRDARIQAILVKYDLMIAARRALGDSKTDVDPIKEFIGDRKKTKEELVKEVNILRDRMIDLNRTAAKCTKDIENYRGAMKALHKKVEDRTTEDLEALQRVKNDGCENPTLAEMHKKCSDANTRIEVSLEKKKFNLRKNKICRISF